MTEEAKTIAEEKGAEKKTGTRKGRNSQKAKEERKSTRTRVPYAANAPRLAVPQSVRDQYPNRPDFCFRWVNDEEGEVQRRLDAGWEVCRGQGISGSFLNPKGASNDGDVVARPVGPGKTTASLMAVLMTIEEQFFLEDKALQDKANMAFQDSLKKDKSEAGQVQSDNTYVPLTEDGQAGFSRKQSETIS